MLCVVPLSSRCVSGSRALLSAWAQSDAGSIQARFPITFGAFATELERGEFKSSVVPACFEGMEGTYGVC